MQRSKDPLEPSVISDLLTRIDATRVIGRLAPVLLGVSTATVTVAYYEVHGPVLNLLFLSSVLWLWLSLRNRQGVGLDGATALFSGIFLLYALVAILAAGRIGFNADALNGLDRFSAFLAGVILLPCLVRARVNPLWFWSAIAITAALSGLHAFWEMHLAGGSFHLSTELGYRAGGSKGKQIPFGDIAALTAAISGLAACVWFRTWRGWSILFGTAALLGVYASIASGTRGAWLFLPTALLVIGLYLSQQYPARRRTILRTLLGLVLAGGLALGLSSQMTGRIATAVSEIRGYAAGAAVQPGNSMGERFEMWRAAWMASQEHPLLGIGVGQLNGYFKDAARRGLISPAIAEFDGGTGHTHAHNDYMNALATRGSLGLGSLLLLYLVPLGRFARTAIVAGSDAQRGLGYAGILLVLAYMQFSLTDSLLIARITAGYFVLLCVWLLAMNLNLRGTPPGQPGDGA